MRLFAKTTLWAALALAVMTAAMLLRPGLAATEAETASVPTAYTLGTGDKLKITVFGEEGLTGDYEIDGDGLISMALLGEVKAKGMTLRAFNKALTAQLGQYLKSPRVSAEVINYRPFYIIGEVKTPGQYPYVNGMTVINGVAIAGGYTYRANENEVIVQRGGKEIYVPADDTWSVLPGDTIIVRERFF